MLQEQQNLSSARRSGKSGIRLLDDGENNVGNATLLQPQSLSGGELFTVQTPNPPPARLLNLTASSKTGQSVTVVMTAARAAGQVSGVAGTITGLIEFGNGTQSTQIEFDIPLGPYIGQFRSVSQFSQPQDSGAVIQVPTGVVRAYARYDNAYITPELAGYAFGGPGSPSFPLFAGAGPFAPNLGLPTPVQVKAFANYFGRHYSKLYKTHYLYVGDKTRPQLFREGGSPIPYAVPPFAKSVRVVVEPAVSLTIQLTDQQALGATTPNPPLFAEGYVIPAGTYWRRSSQRAPARSWRRRAIQRWLGSCRGQMCSVDEGVAVTDRHRGLG
jgi:hypothetical protein